MWIQYNIKTAHFYVLLVFYRLSCLPTGLVFLDVNILCSKNDNKFFFLFVAANKIEDKCFFIKIKCIFRFKCEHCSKGYSTERHLVLHLRCHNDVRPYVCERCPASFLKAEQLKSHLLFCIDKMYSCNSCSKVSFCIVSILIGYLITKINIDNQKMFSSTGFCVFWKIRWTFKISCK